MHHIFLFLSVSFCFAFLSCKSTRFSLNHGPFAEGVGVKKTERISESCPQPAAKTLHGYLCLLLIASVCHGWTSSRSLKHPLKRPLKCPLMCWCTKSMNFHDQSATQTLQSDQLRRELANAQREAEVRDPCSRGLCGGLMDYLSILSPTAIPS